MLLSLLTSNPVAFFVIAAILLLSLTVHEFAHAYTADRLGDSTPRRFGRVTLNPAAHLDLFGAIAMLLIGFGFAKPVPVNGAAVGRWGMLWVAAAGPLSNLAIAFVAGLLLRFLPSSAFLSLVLSTVLSINIVLAVFNLLPIPLLDGSRIVAALFPRTLGRSLMEFERMPYSFLIVFGFILLFQGQLGQFVAGIQRWVVNLIGLI